MKIVLILTSIIAIALSAATPVENMPRDDPCQKCTDHYKYCREHCPWYNLPWCHSICESDTCKFEDCKSKCNWGGC